MEEHSRLARELLFSGDVLNDTDRAPSNIAAAQAWAMLALADALDRLAQAVEALQNR